MAQPIILLTDIPGLGQIGDQKKVKEGYARNYLLPKRLAVLATPNAIKRAEKQKDKIQAEREKFVNKAKTLAEKVSQVGLVFEKPMGQGGRLFGSVTAQEIASDLAQHGATVDKRSILMDGSLKTPGDHKIRVRIHSQVIVDVPVKIVGIAVNQSSFASEFEEEGDEEQADPGANQETQETKAKADAKPSESK